MRARLAVRRLLVWCVLLSLGTVSIPAGAERFQVPIDHTRNTIEKILTQDLPARLLQATCGWPILLQEDDAQTHVFGLPLRPVFWRGKPTGDEDPQGNPYPANARGLMMANACPALELSNPPCRSPDECRNLCRDVNTKRYKMYRVSECDVHHAVTASSSEGAAGSDGTPSPGDGGGVPTDGGDGGPPIGQDPGRNRSPFLAQVLDMGGGGSAGSSVPCITEHVLTDATLPDGSPATPDCNSCPQSDPECAPSEVTDYAYFGDKYICASDGASGGEPAPRTDGYKVKNGDWWVPGNPSGASEWCTASWGGTSSARSAPCTRCSGGECRTGRLASASSDAGDGGAQQYTSFFRVYHPTHRLAPVSGTASPAEEHPEDTAIGVPPHPSWTEIPQGDITFITPNGSSVGGPDESWQEGESDSSTAETTDTTLGCYGWYSETLDPKNPSDLRCVANDLKLDDMDRRVRAPETVTLADGFPPIASYGGFTLAPDSKTGSHFQGPSVPLVNFLRPFGETATYVSPLQRIERAMEELPPTVQLILPRVQTGDEVRQLFSRDDGPEQPASLLEYSVPLRPGLIEAVRSVLRQSLFGRMEEEALPVVVPLVGEGELQAKIEAWEGWRDARQARNEDASAADPVIQRLYEYRTQMQAYGQLRAALPFVLAKVMKQRTDLSAAIDKWVASRMAAYTQAISDQEQRRDFFLAWLQLKSAYAAVGVQNAPYCKSDRTTPDLPWIEPDGGLALPEIPRQPRHYTFDFSDIYLEGTTQLNALKIPILQPVFVALSLPAPPNDSTAVAPPNLPSLPPPPTASAPFSLPVTVIEEAYKPPPPVAVPAFPYAALAQSFRAAAETLSNVRQRYATLLWVRDPHPDLACPQSGTGGCVFPETRLWDAFMRLWAPIGATYLPGTDPPGTAIAASSSSSACPPHDDACLLSERLIRDSLRITLPKEGSAGDPAFVETLRQFMRGTVLGWGGLLAPSPADAPPYDIAAPQDLYESFATPFAIPLDASSASRL